MMKMIKKFKKNFGINRIEQTADIAVNRIRNHEYKKSAPINTFVKYDEIIEDDTQKFEIFMMQVRKDWIW